MIQFQRLLSILALASLLGLTSCASGPRTTIERFHHAVENGKVDQALALLADHCVERFGAEKWRLLFKQRALEINEKGGIKSIETKGDPPKDDHVQLLVTVTYSNGENDSDWVHLVRQKGSWRIDCEK